MRGINPNEKFKRLSGLGVMTVPFGGVTKQEEFHPGVDYANDKGTPVPATVPGTVIKAEGGHVQGENNFGNTVEIKSPEGDIHQFHHLENVHVQPGQQIQPGEQIGTMGNTGATYSQSGKGDGTHLDYRIVDAYGRYKNPAMYLKK